MIKMRISVVFVDFDKYGSTFGMFLSVDDTRLIGCESLTANLYVFVQNLDFFGFSCLEIYLLYPNFLFR